MFPFILNVKFLNCRLLSNLLKSRTVNVLYSMCLKCWCPYPLKPFKSMSLNPAKVKMIKYFFDGS